MLVCQFSRLAMKYMLSKIYVFRKRSSNNFVLYKLKHYAGMKHINFFFEIVLRQSLLTASTLTVSTTFLSIDGMAKFVKLRVNNRQKHFFTLLSVTNNKFKTNCIWPTAIVGLVLSISKKSKRQPNQKTSATTKFIYSLFKQEYRIRTGHHPHMPRPRK